MSLTGHTLIQDLENETADVNSIYPVSTERSKTVSERFENGSDLVLNVQDVFCTKFERT